MFAPGLWGVLLHLFKIHHQAIQRPVGVLCLMLLLLVDKALCNNYTHVSCKEIELTGRPTMILVDHEGSSWRSVSAASVRAWKQCECKQAEVQLAKMQTISMNGLKNFADMQEGTHDPHQEWSTSSSREEGCDDDSHDTRL